MPDFRYPIRSTVVQNEQDDGSITTSVVQERQPIGTGNSLPDAMVHREPRSEMEKAEKK